MALLESRLDRNSPSFAENAQRMERLVARVCASGWSRFAPAAAPKRSKNIVARNKLTDARARRTADRSRLGLLGTLARLPLATCTATTRRRRESLPESACVEGQHCVDRRQRRDRQRRHLLSDDGKEASARARDRRAESSSVHLSRRFGRRVLTAAGRSLSRIATTSAAFFTTKRACRANASRRSPR